MLTRRKRQAIGLFVFGCVLFLVGTCLWLSSGAPTQSDICQQDSQTHEEECSSYNIAFVTIWHIAKFFDDHNGTFNALFAAAVAVFTWFLWKATVGLRESTDKLWDAGERQIGIARDAADAAKLNAQAVIDTERARIYIVIDARSAERLVSRFAGVAQYINSPEMDDAHLDPTPKIEYSLVNHGRTPALLKEISHHLAIQPEFSLSTVEYARRILPMPIDYILVGGKSSAALVCDFDSVITVGQAKAIAKGATSIWLYGYVAYDDAFGWGRQLDYVWRLDFQAGSFSVHHSRERGNPHKH